MEKETIMSFSLGIESILSPTFSQKIFFKTSTLTFTGFLPLSSFFYIPLKYQNILLTKNRMHYVQIRKLRPRVEGLRWILAALYPSFKFIR
jgi:hypothetical protein